MASSRKKKSTDLNWAELMVAMTDINEKQCLQMLEQEAKGLNRMLWKQRLYQRYSKLRRLREHKEYLRA